MFCPGLWTRHRKVTGLILEKYSIFPSTCYADLTKQFSPGLSLLLWSLDYSLEVQNMDNPHKIF